MVNGIMTNPYSLFGTDKALEKEGIVLDYGPFQIRIARAGGANAKFARVMEVKLRPYRRALDAGTLDEEIAKRLIAEAYAEAVVLDWENVTDENGQSMDCTVPNIVKLFLDLPELFADVQSQATKAALFRKAEVEEATDFLAADSAGN
jgi:hypothetical protein